jgi:hypothetical protein
VLPTYQRFHATDAIGTQVELWLVQQEELVSLEATAQARLQRQALEQVRVGLLSGQSQPDALIPDDSSPFRPQHSWFRQSSSD